MENIAPIQIAEPKREKRAAVTAAYRRGYADALEDMRKKAEGEETPPPVFYYTEIEWYSVTGIYGVGSPHIRGGRYNSDFNSAVSAVYDFQPGNVHSE